MDWTNLVESPLEIVRQRFHTQVSTQEVSKLRDVKVEVDEFKRLADDEEAFEKVPWLTKEGIANGWLKSGMMVRFRGMVQDMFDPEYYDGIVECSDGQKTWYETSKYQEMVRPQAGVEHLALENGTGLMERFPVFCVSVPGEADWAKANRLTTNEYNCKHQTEFVAKKCSIDPSATTTTQSRKRVQLSELDGGDQENDTKKRNNVDQQTTMETDSSEKGETKEDKRKNCVEQVRMSIPIPEGDDTSNCSCIVKLYDDDMSSFQLNELVDFVGILSITPEFNKASSGQLEDHFMGLEISARQPPSSLVPRLHCVCYKKNPGPVLKAGDLNLPTEQLRQQVLEVVSRNVFHGDKLAAEYLLLWLASGVFGRPCEDILVGKLTLAFTEVGSVEEGRAATDRIKHLLAQVLPKYQYLALDVEELNGYSLGPKKCYEANRLRAGRLQTCKHTPVIVDETKLTPGNLNPQGVKNMDALVQLASKQLVTYDFQYYTKEWEVDLPVLILTSNRKPLTEGSDCLLPLRTQQHKDGQVSTSITEDELNAIRVYVERVAQLDQDKFDIPSEVCNVLESEFVKRRQEDKSVSQNDLHLWLNLARLYERSLGRQTLSVEHWREVCTMEQSRRQRQ